MGIYDMGIYKEGRALPGSARLSTLQRPHPPRSSVNNSCGRATPRKA